MRLLVDECCEAALVARLRRAGHDVEYVAEISASASDVAILARAHAENRLLVTDDKGFGELVVKRRFPAAGIVLLRIEALEHAIRAHRLLFELERLGEKLIGRIAVIDPTLTRLRSVKV